MKIIILVSLLSITTLVQAETPVVIITEGWKNIPIIVNDNADYFYAQQVCPPELVILPHVQCGIKQNLQAIDATFN